MPGSCCLASHVILFPQSMHVKRHRMCVYVFVSKLFLCLSTCLCTQVLFSNLAYLCTCACIISTQTKLASCCPSSETNYNEKDNSDATTLPSFSPLHTLLLGYKVPLPLYTVGTWVSFQLAAVLNKIHVSNLCSMDFQLLSGCILSRSGV